MIRGMTKRTHLIILNLHLKTKSIILTEIILNPHQRKNISEKILGEDNIREEITGKKRITSITQGGINQKLLLETVTLKGEIQAQPGINHLAINIEETTRGNQMRGLPAIPGVDHQCIEIKEHKPVFGVEIII